MPDAAVAVAIAIVLLAGLAIIMVEMWSGAPPLE